MMKSRKKLIAASAAVIVIAGGAWGYTTLKGATPENLLDSLDQFFSTACGFDNPYNYRISHNISEFLVGISYRFGAGAWSGKSPPPVVTK